MRDKEALLDRVAGFLNAWDPKLEDFIAANRKALDKVNYTRHRSHHAPPHSDSESSMNIGCAFLRCPAAGVDSAAGASCSTSESSSAMAAGDCVIYAAIRVGEHCLHSSFLQRFDI